MSIIISVDVLETGQRTKAQFPGAVSVEEANAQLREKVHLDSGDFALFKVTRPADEVTAMTEAAIQKLRVAKGLKKEKKDAKKEEVPPEPIGVWLKPKKTLESYDLSGEDALMLRRRHKVIKVKTSDEASKSVIVDLAQPVKDVLVTIGVKFGLEHTEEYALQWERTERWLLNTQTITEQGNSNAGAAAPGVHSGARGGGVGEPPGDEGRGGDVCGAAGAGGVRDLQPAVAQAGLPGAAPVPAAAVSEDEGHGGAGAAQLAEHRDDDAGTGSCRWRRRGRRCSRWRSTRRPRARSRSWCR